MVTEIELLAAVDAAFEITARRLTRWPDPHPHRSPLDEEYSRLSDPAICVTWFLYCGCDACDGGSQQELDQLDARVRQHRVGCVPPAISP